MLETYDIIVNQFNNLTHINTLTENIYSNIAYQTKSLAFQYNEVIEEKDNIIMNDIETKYSACLNLYDDIADNIVKITIEYESLVIEKDLPRHRVSPRRSAGHKSAQAAESASTCRFPMPRTAPWSALLGYEAKTHCTPCALAPSDTQTPHPSPPLRPGTCRACAHPRWKSQFEAHGRTCRRGVWLS